MSKFKLCGPDNMCEFLSERVLLGMGGGAGLHTVETYNFTTEERIFRGVAYKMNAKDNGLMINHCPFCGKRPGVGDLS